MPKRILLADDSITIQKVVELTFSDGDYEVTAVNNGAKAVHKLGEMRPDIILSDIIMPEKNGYEVCEYVKSNPEYRNIPVVLLTGTFEPFDPDRAEKAGCDAVVTKPFESQSLIQKVEELIASARAAAAAPPPPAPEAVAPAPSPWMDDEPAAPEAPPAPSPFTTASGTFPAAGDAYTHGSDIFAAAPAPDAATEMPFDAAPDTPFGGETRAFPRMSFDDFQQPAATPAPPPPPAEPSPWDEQDFGGETRAFGKMSFDDLQSMQQPLETPAAPAPEAESPFGAPPPAEEFSSETRAFERVNFDELQQQMAAPAETTGEPELEAAPPSPAAPSPWDEPAETPFGGETRAFPTMSFDDLQAQAPAAGREEAQPEPQAPQFERPQFERPQFDTPQFETPRFDTPRFDTPQFDTPQFGTPQFEAPQPEPASPWDEQPAFGGETRAFPKMSFDELAASAPTPEPQSAAPESLPEPAPWDEPAAPAWTPEVVPETSPAASSDSFATAAYVPFTPPAEATPAPTQAPESELPPAERPMTEDLPFAASTTGEPELEAAPAAARQQADEPQWTTSPAAEAEAEPGEPVVPPPVLAPESPAIPIRAAELSDEQVDRIARRVVELMSDHVVRNIAWEVIPDLAEMVVKERIRQLESEA